MNNDSLAYVQYSFDGLAVSEDSDFDERQALLLLGMLDTLLLRYVYLRCTILRCGRMRLATLTATAAQYVVQNKMHCAHEALYRSFV
jgi:hypothetical protein